MLTEKYTNNINPNNQLEFNNVSKELLPWLEELITEMAIIPNTQT